MTLKRFRKDSGGAAAVEFAIVVPVFLAIMMTIWEFGWAQHKLSSIRFAMEKASRDLMVNNSLTEAQMSTKVKGYLNGVADQNVTITMTSDTVSGATVKKLKGVYSTSIGIPGMATMPINWQTTVTTPMP
ncbi:MAG TPA: TadE/TadG family type IV pilus assembly protein [Caulobacteraceae bacterium]|nr:TadE/TadG family type IV pilus assembly protein [Caulobacteraceae bacterium]